MMDLLMGKMVRDHTMPDKTLPQLNRSMPLGFEKHLSAAASAAAHLASTGKETFGARERRSLIAAFHKAESLAEFALEDATEQVRESYRADLVRQRHEEEKHVRVFASYLDDVEAVPRPKGRKRPEAVWFTLLLLNELTGYCQFAFLYPLLDPSEQILLEEVMTEEEEHVERLLRWMLPVWEERGGPQAIRMVERFRDDLPGRMEQFFEGDELRALREGMEGVVSKLLNQLLGLVR